MGILLVWVWEAGLPGTDRRISQSRGCGKGWSLEGREQRIWVWTGIAWTPLGQPPSFPLLGRIPNSQAGSDLPPRTRR